MIGHTGAAFFLTLLPLLLSQCATPAAADGGGDEDGTQPLRIASIFIVLVAGMAGGMLPVVFRVSTKGRGS